MPRPLAATSQATAEHPTRAWVVRERGARPPFDSAQGWPLNSNSSTRSTRASRLRGVAAFLVAAVRSNVENEPIREGPQPGQ